MPGFGSRQASRRRRAGGIAPPPPPLLGALSLSTATLAENTPPGSVIGAILGRSAGSALTLTDDAGGRFAIGGTNLLTGLTGFDYETGTSHNVTIRETLAGATNTPRDTVLSLAVSDVSEGGPAALRVATGTYNGTGNPIDVNLSFRPDLVFVWCDDQPLVWRTRTSWHGRSQRFDAASSSYVLRSSVEANEWLPFLGARFGVNATYSVSARVYRYMAIKHNETATLEEVTIVGNQLNNRALDFTSRRSELIVAKRDSSRSSVWTTDGAVPQRAVVADGPLASAVAFTNAGATLSSSIWVNQNDNIGLGEAIEYLSFISADGVTVTRRTGTGGATTVSGMGSAVIIIPCGSGAEKGQIVSEGQNGSIFDGVGAPANPISLAAGVLSLPSVYNTAAAEYIILSLADTASSDVDPVVEPVATQIGQVATYAELSSGISLSGACSYEYYGRPLGYSEPAFFYPLLFFGDGTDGGTSGMNGGAYLYTTDPDANGWVGGVLRIIHSNYLATNRTAPHASINYYNFNTGIVIGRRDIVHLVVTHNGSGKWRVFLYGKLVKEYNLNINQATYGNRLNGGGGTSLPVYANGTPTRPRMGDLYRAQVWNAALSDADAASLFENAQDGSAWGGTAPLGAWDFRGSIAGGTTGATLGAKRAPDPVYWLKSTTIPGVPSYSGANVRITATGVSNGRAYTRLGSGTFDVHTEIDVGTCSRIICRTAADTLGVTGTTVFDITGTTPISRTDSVTCVDSNLFYVGIGANGTYFGIKSTTTITRTA